MQGPQPIAEIRERLLARSEALRADIRRELKKYDAETYGDLIDRIADPGEQSVADLLVDLDLAEVNRDVDEFREVEAALLRLTSGMYGTCIACDEDIEPERLDKYPAAPRCYLCQQAFEASDHAVRHRTL